MPKLKNTQSFYTCYFSLRGILDISKILNIPNIVKCQLKFFFIYSRDNYTSRHLPEIYFKTG